MYTARPQAPQARQKYLFLTYNGLLRVSNTSDALNFACSELTNCQRKTTSTTSTKQYLVPT